MCSVRTNHIIIARAVDSAAECLPGMIRLPAPNKPRDHVSASCTRTRLHNEPSYGFLLSADTRRCGVKLPAEERMKLVWRTAIVCCVLILITTVWMVYTTFYVVSQPDVHVCLHITNVLLQELLPL